MTRFPLRVLRTLRERALVTPGDGVLVAYSGGPDSTALLEVLCELLPRLGALVAGLVHVHHGLRGDAADRDLDACRDEAARRGLRYLTRHVDVPGEARRRRWSIERTAHVLRHSAFRDAAAEAGATRVALGHTRDDQAETVLLRFLRGAGTRGLGGMWPRTGLVIRPLIDVSRAQVEQFLTERGLSSLEDVSNTDLGIARNRIRHEVLPALEAVAGPRLAERLAAQSEAWRDEEAYLAEVVAPWLARALSAERAGWRYRPAIVAAAPESLRGRIRLSVARELLRKAVSGLAVARLRRVEQLAEGRRVTYGRWIAERQGEDVRFEQGAGAVSDRGGRRNKYTVVNGAGPELTVPLPGTLELAGLGIRLDSEVREAAGLSGAGLAAPHTAALDASSVEGGLLVRTWRAGDRLRPRGLGGSQKLQDLFVNRKVPRDQRSRVPVVTTLDGRVVWVVGLAVDESFAVSPTTSRVVILRATHPGGKA